MTDLCEYCDGQTDYESLLGAPRPLSLTGELLGRSGDPGPYPVSIQGHAVEQRWCRLLNGGLCLYGFLARSLTNPAVHPGDKGAVLVAYRVEEKCLGHFVCRVVDDVALVRTFLLPGMKGTPEAKCLHEKLGLAPADIRQHQLDKLKTYLFSDLAHDPELAKLFEECGFGTLLRMARKPEGLGREEATAQVLRSYLGMGPGSLPAAGVPGDEQAPAVTSKA